MSEYNTQSTTYTAGYVTAYGAAKRGGYTGTYEEFCAAIAGMADVVGDLENFSVVINTLSPGSQATASYADGVLTLGVPQGAKGDKGDKGDTGEVSQADLDAAIEEVSDELAGLKNDLSDVNERIDNVGFDVSKTGVLVDITTSDNVSKCKIDSSANNTAYRTGDNLFWTMNNGRTTNGITFSFDDDYKLHVTGVSTNTAWLYTNNVAWRFYLPAGNYTLTGETKNVKLQFGYEDAGGNWVMTRLHAQGTDGETIHVNKPNAGLAQVCGCVYKGTDMGSGETLEITLALDTEEHNWTKPQRTSVSVTAGVTAELELINGLNYVFTETEADFTYQVPVSTLQPQIDDIKDDITELQAEIGQGGFNPSSIIQKYLDRNDILAQMTDNPLFLIYTDIHGFFAYQNRIAEYYNNNCKAYVKDILLLGDIVYNEFSDSSAVLDTDFGKKSLITIGNHDCYDGTTVGGVNVVSLYNKFMTNVNQWNVIQPTGASENGYIYYYKDYDETIRLIVLNEYYWDNTQKTWFEGVLSDALTNNLSVIVMQHQGNYTPTEYEPLSDDYAFSTKENLFIRYTNGYLERRNAVDSFIASGGDFITWLGGHTHCELFGTFTVNNRKQLSMIFSNSGQDKTSRLKIVNYSQDCFYYLSVDTTNKIVKVLTVGQDVNKFFKRNLLLAYNYNTHEVVQYYG